MEAITVLIPTYNNADTIEATIKSVLRQTYENFNIVVVDDCSTDSTVDVINWMCDERVRVFVNPVNLGCGRNLTKCVSMAETDVVYFLCGDDIILDKSTLWFVAHAFEMENISVFTRNYHWFDKDPARPIRKTRIWHDDLVNIVASLDQISGIALRKSRICNDFSNESFIEMASVAYPMIQETSNVVFFNSEDIAIRVHPMNSVSFKKSPIKNWYSIVGNDEYLVKNFIALNYVGLVQIKNYGTYKQLFREIGFLVKYRPMNLLSIKFWFFVLGTLLVPGFILKRLVELYRRVPK